MSARPNTVGELLERKPLPSLDIDAHNPIESARLSMIRMRRRLGGHSSEDLLALKHTAETTAHLIGLELARRDAALIDSLCKLED